MDKRQKSFLMIIAALVALFILILLGLSLGKRQSIPAPLPLTPTVQVPATGPERTSTPKTAPGAVTSTPGASASSPSASPTPAAAGPRAFYVSPDGSNANDGTIERPWPLQFVLSQPPAVQPGDTIWMLGGTYRGPFALRLKGIEGKPITVRALPGQRVTLTSDDLVLDIQDCAYVDLWGFEITAMQNKRDPFHRQPTAYGVRINQSKDSHDIKFINLIVHDMPAQGFGWWHANVNSEIYGSLIYYNGATEFDHGIYLNNNSGEKTILDNIIFDNASHGIHAYGEKDYQQLNNLDIEGNTVFDNGSIGKSTKTGALLGSKRNILVGGLLAAQKPVVKDNYTYFSSGGGESFNLGFHSGSNGAVVEDNYFANGSITLGGLNSGLEMAQNTILGLSLKSLALAKDNMLVIKPADTKIFVRPNQYEPGRANITIYNWLKQDTVALTSNDLKGIQIHPGDHYELHNVQDYFGDVISGTYDGEKIDISMTGHTVAQPLGLDFKPPSTFPQFGAFVLITQPSTP